MEINSYNDHCSAPFSRALVGWTQHHQLYSGVGADIVMESITLIDRARSRILTMIKISPKPNILYSSTSSLFPSSVVIVSGVTLSRKKLFPPSRTTRLLVFVPSASKIDPVQSGSIV